MSDYRSSEQLITKTENTWPLGCHIRHSTSQVTRWATLQQELTGFDFHPNHQTKNLAVLELYKDERCDYRFNLNSTQPKLFVVLDSLSSDLASEVVPANSSAANCSNTNGSNASSSNMVTLTASQSVAAQYMDGDYLVLSATMPIQVQAWLEAFIGRHGEVFDVRRKKRSGAGRSSE